MRKFIAFTIVLMFTLPLAVFAGGTKEEKPVTLVFGDLSWDSAAVHNRIAAYIIQNGIGDYNVEYTAADTLVTVNGLIQGDIDVDMESWHSNFMEVYDKAIASGDIVDLGQNMPDAPQGWWIPRYLTEGADAPAPDLKSVADLPKYWKLFKDPEDPAKGLVYMGTAGWSATKVSEDIFKQYGLADTFNQGVPGSSAALAATMVGAYKQRKPWVGYYWAPTPILGKLDMVRLKGSEFEPALVNKLVSRSLTEKAPEVAAFLKNYKTTVAENNEFLSVMDDNKWSSGQTALWFLKNKKDVWTAWVSADVAAKVNAALDAGKGIAD